MWKRLGANLVLGIGGFLLLLSKVIPFLTKLIFDNKWSIPSILLSIQGWDLDFIFFF